MKTNIEEAKALVAKYKQFIKEANVIKETLKADTLMGKTWRYILVEYTGFGSTETCTLCKAVGYVAAEDVTSRVFPFMDCASCVWSHKNAKGLQPVKPCTFNTNFATLNSVGISGNDFLDALKERIQMLEERIAEAEGRELTVEDLKSHIRTTLENENIMSEGYAWKKEAQDRLDLFLKCDLVLKDTKNDSK
jgi:hypothetical protein